jgi:hypothetical protein
MQYKKRAVVMKRAREESGEDAASAGAGGSSAVPSTIDIEPEERNQCQSSSPCTSDSDDGGEDEERASPPSSSASSACSGIYYNNSALRFPIEADNRKPLPAVIRLPPLHHQVPNGRPLPCPPKLAITRGTGHASSSTIAALMNAAISSSHCDYRKLQAKKGSQLGTTGPASTTKTVSPILAPIHAKNVERLGPPKKRAKRTVSFNLRADERGGGSSCDDDDVRPCAAAARRARSTTETLSEDQLLFVEAAASLRRSGRQAQQQQQMSHMPPPMALAEAARLPEGTAATSSLATPGNLQRALPPPPSSLQILAPSRLV